MKLKIQFPGYTCHTSTQNRTQPAPQEVPLDSTALEARSDVRLMALVMRRSPVTLRIALSEERWVLMSYPYKGPEQGA